MNAKKSLLVTLGSAVLLSACVSAPLGPTVQVLPSPTKPFQVFQQDQVDCKQYAQSQVAGQADVANEKAIGTAAIGTALGVVLGAAIGNHQGAGALGAGGAVVGTAAGSGGTTDAQYSIQAQYNNAYVQCMYSRGNQIPGAMR